MGIDQSELAYDTLDFMSSDAIEELIVLQFFKLSVHR